MDDAVDGAELWPAPFLLRDDASEDCATIGSSADGPPPADAAASGEIERRVEVRFSPEVARAVCARVAAGESQVSICSDAGMPSRASVLRWSKEMPTFAKALAKAKAVSGRKARGYPSTYCAATAHEIFERMCEGEGISVICRDPDMPAYSTVYYWRKQFPEFAEAIATARKIQAERLCDLGWEIACGITPETAYATHVKLGQLRWMTSVLSPKAFGRTKPVEADDGEAERGGGLTVILKRYAELTDEERGMDQPPPPSRLGSASP